MRRVLALGLIGVVLATAGGCGGPDAQVRAVVADMNRLSDAIEKNEPEARQKELAQRVQTGMSKFDQLKLTEEQKKALFDKHADEMAAASKRLAKALESGNSKFDAPSLFR